MKEKTKKTNRSTNHCYSYLLREDSPFSLTEAYRNIMTNISFAIPKKEEGVGKIVCITSSVSDEGKTTIASNLALTFANAGKKVLLLDCDLRKHNVSRVFRIKPEYGLAEYLSGEIELDNVIQKNVAERLDVLCGCKSAPNPIVLFNSANFDALLETLSHSYDFIVMDTPPLGVVSDGMTLSAKSDGVVVIVKHLLSHKILQETIANLEFANCNLLGFVLKDFLLTKHSGYYYKYYYNNYYGQESPKKAKKEKKTKKHD